MVYCCAVEAISCSTSISIVIKFIWNNQEWSFFPIAECCPSSFDTRECNYELWVWWKLTAYNLMCWELKAQTKFKNDHNEINDFKLAR